MKISRTGGVQGQASSRGGKVEGGFSLGGAAQASGPAASAAMSGLGGVSSVSALLALQETDTVEERRRKAIRRGGGLLDRLDALKVALLEGGGGNALQALARAVAEERQDQDDAGLKDVLDHIETRAAVELAKARMR